ncbi:DUF3458 domain-containing protein (plasmid) [Rahnella aquatilis]|nr:DUF3458 domain-containing protein [Rahnella aquatilis]
MFVQVENNRSTEAYVFDHPNMARRALKNTALGWHLRVIIKLNESLFVRKSLTSLCVCFVEIMPAYLASLEDPAYVELALGEYKSATNLTDQIAALAALAQKPGQTRDEVLADFYNKWQGDYLV